MAFLAVALKALSNR